MPVTDKLIRELWDELQGVVESPSESSRLQALTDDPTVAAKTKRDEIGEHLKGKYDSDILTNVAIASIGATVIINDREGNLLGVGLGGPRDGTEHGMYPETNVLTYLRGAGVAQEDTMTVMRYGKLHRIYWGTLMGLVEETNLVLSSIYRCTLPEFLNGLVDDMDPTPQYEEEGRSLTYEIMDHRRINTGDDEERPYFLGRFTKDEAKIVQTILKADKYVPNSGEESDVCIRLLEAGLIERNGTSYMPKLLDAATATVAVMNIHTLYPRDVNSLSDIPKLRY